MNYVGIDIYKRYSVCATQDEQGRRLRGARIEGNSASAFAQYLAGLEGPCQIALEACWNWGTLYDRLAALPQVEEVVVAHPLKTRLIGEAQIKTDKIDAQALATLLRGNFISRVHVPQKAVPAQRPVTPAALLCAPAQEDPQPDSCPLGSAGEIGVAPV